MCARERGGPAAAEPHASGGIGQTDDFVPEDFGRVVVQKPNRERLK
ncbi:hypothetical protein FRUB_01594 [Fimbriiglobus ruber]|uniref:Uncharacterized protein n=1 Tax=Fimbriiglobus ruber TaxID=1908690 RepID=A0A225DW45_9BACT|nr:hypothetical protein FRUB_01594 [Fimbriiglobus ruber]